MKTSLLPTFLSCLALVATGIATAKAPAQSAAFDWAAKLPGTGEYSSMDLAADHEGGGFLVQQVGSGVTADMVSRIDASGAVRWTKRLVPHVGQIVADPSGGLYVVGGDLKLVAGLRKPANFFSRSGIATEGTGSAYVAKVDPNGSLEWVRLIGKSLSIDAVCLAVDGEGNYYSAGQYWNGEAVIGDTHLAAREPDPTAPEAYNFFVAKHSRDGTVQWVRSGTSSYAWPTIPSIAVDSAGNVFVAGYSFEPVSIEDVVVSANPSFLLKFDPEGRLLWTRVPVFQGFGGATVAADRDGNAYFACNGLLAKYGPSGDLLWTRQALNENAVIHNTKIAVDPDGNCLVSGGFTAQDHRLETSMLTFGNSTVAVSDTSSIGWDIFTVKYARSGDVGWAIQTDRSVSGGVRSAGVAVSSLGGVLIAGHLYGEVRFGDSELVGPLYGLGNDMFTAHIWDPEMVRPVLQIQGGPADLRVRWPASAAGFVLETAESVSALGWTSVPGEPALDGDQRVVAIEVSSNPKFFRLRRP